LVPNLELFIIIKPVAVAVKPSLFPLSIHSRIGER